MSSNTHKSWLTAQRAEKKYSSAFEHVKLPVESRFFPEKFPLSRFSFNNKRILEVGCTPAAEIHRLEVADLKVGIDPLANEWNRLYRNGVHHIQGVGECLPFRDRTFDIVLCLNALDHVQRPVSVLREACRVLRDGGALILWLQTYSVSQGLRRLLSILDRAHPHHFEDDEVLAIVDEVGFRLSYHSSRKPSLNSVIQYLRDGGPSLIASGLKYLSARLFLGLHESAYLLTLQTR